MDRITIFGSYVDDFRQRNSLDYAVEDSLIFAEGITAQFADLYQSHLVAVHFLQACTNRNNLQNTLVYCNLQLCESTLLLCKTE